MEPSRPESFGERVRRYREARQWSQRDLANAAGVSQATIAKIENGTLQRTLLETVRGLAQAFHVSLDELVGPAGSDPQDDRGVPRIWALVR
jgi:transcriptional regulator with XRE-family HTH domain